MSAGVEPTSTQLPIPEVGPLRKMGRRLLFSLLLLLAMFVVVAVDRHGYRDAVDGDVSLIDALYYTTVSLSTTGYGDIIPVTRSARLANIFLVTPLRIAFLVVLVGTTLEVLTERTRQQWRLTRWRAALHNHTVVIGYGVKGRSAVDTLLRNDISKDQIVVVDRGTAQVGEAVVDGYATVLGDSTRSSVLVQAGVPEASHVIITVDRDDTAVLVTLTARQLNAHAVIVAAVREAENATLVSQSGATSVITSSDAAGRLLGIATVTPEVSDTVAELLIPGTGLEIIERLPVDAEIGRTPAECDALIVAILRGEERLHYDEVDRLSPTDRLIVITT